VRYLVAAKVALPGLTANQPLQVCCVLEPILFPLILSSTGFLGREPRFAPLPYGVLTLCTCIRLRRGNRSLSGGRKGLLQSGHSLGLQGWKNVGVLIHGERGTSMTKAVSVDYIDGKGPS
jgi:hypothetical protein